MFFNVYLARISKATTKPALPATQKTDSLESQKVAEMRAKLAERKWADLKNGGTIVKRNINIIVHVPYRVREDLKHCYRFVYNLIII